MLVFLPSQTVYAPLASAQIPDPIEVQQVIAEPEPPKEVIKTDKHCNCFNLLTETFKNVPSARSIKASAGVPFGNVVVLRENGLDHFAIVEGQGMGEFYIHEWGKFEGKCVDRRRTIKFGSSNVVGFVTLE